MDATSLISEQRTPNNIEIDQLEQDLQENNHKKVAKKNLRVL